MPTTPWARFLVEQRLAAGWTQDDVFAKVRDQLGWGENSRSAYINLEHGPQQGGRDPNPDERAVFSALYDGREPNVTPEQPELSFEKQQLALLLRQVEAQERQANAMELHVRLLARQTIATEAMAVAQGAPLPGSRDDWIALEDEILALGQSVLADRTSRAPLSARLPLGEG